MTVKQKTKNSVCIAIQKYEGTQLLQMPFFLLKTEHLGENPKSELILLSPQLDAAGTCLILISTR